MRLQLTVQRHTFPPVKVLYNVGAAQPTSSTAVGSLTISQFLEQVNEVIPLEAENWGLEDYAVEVKGFECLHFNELNQVLKDDDEVWYWTFFQIWCRLCAELWLAYVPCKRWTSDSGGYLEDIRFHPTEGIS